MSQQLILRGRRKSRHKSSLRRKLRVALTPGMVGAGAAFAYPGYAGGESDDSRRTLVTGSVSALIHLGALGLLLLLASLAPVIDDELIPVQLIRDDASPDEPAPAPRALAERRSRHYAPAAQTLAPQIVNPRVVAAASPAVRAEALEMGAVGSVAAPTAIDHSTAVVERVSAVNSAARARAASVDVARVAAPAVRGPTQLEAPVGPSVGPRQVEATDAAPSMGLGSLHIGDGNGSSVREGVLSHRDVLGSPDGALLVSVDTAIGNSHLRGTGGTGTSSTGGGVGAAEAACIARPEVATYMQDIHDRVVDRWILPPGLDANQAVKLRFRLDVAGSATSVSLVEADDNALGASAVDALRAASPFPPMPEAVRCLSDFSLIGTFTNPFAG
jgi:TonB family protein